MSKARAESKIIPKKTPAIFFNETTSFELAPGTKWRRLTSSLFGGVAKSQSGRILLYRVSPAGLSVDSVAHQGVIAVAPGKEGQFVSISPSECIVWDAKDKTATPKPSSSFKINMIGSGEIEHFECVSKSRGRFVASFFGVRHKNLFGIDADKKECRPMTRSHDFLTFSSRSQSPYFLSLNYRCGADGQFHTQVMDNWIGKPFLKYLAVMCRPTVQLDDDNYNNGAFLIWAAQNLLILAAQNGDRFQFLPMDTKGNPIYSTKLKNFSVVKNPFIAADRLFFRDENNRLVYGVPEGMADINPGLYQTPLPFPVCEEMIALDDRFVVGISAKQPEKVEESSEPDADPIYTATVYELASVDYQYAATENVLTPCGIPRPVISLVAGYANFSIWGNSARLLEMKPIELKFGKIEEELTKLIATKGNDTINSEQAKQSLVALIRLSAALKEVPTQKGLTYKNWIEGFLKKNSDISLAELDEETQAFFKLVSGALRPVQARKR